MNMVKKFVKTLLTLLGYRIIIRKIYRGNNTLDYVRLEEHYLDNEVLKLHFGCGPRVLKGWVNIDLFYLPYDKYLSNLTDEFYPPEIRGSREDFFQIDITKTKLPLPDNSVDVIFHEDFIEHLTQRDQYVFFAETYRVLKKGGIHRVNTPDLEFSLTKNSDFSKGGAGVFTEEWDDHDHFTVLTKKSLKEMAEIVGYSQVKFSKRDESLSEYIPKEFRPSKDRDSSKGNIFADLVK